jgi:protein involved in polysaccharide export with SLBB domain
LTIAADRSQTVIDTGLQYRPGDRVCVRVIHREHRTDVTDDGAGARRAGRPGSWQTAADRVLREFDVNVSAAGVVSLPVVPAGPAEHEVVQRIGEASLALYQELLELSGRAGRPVPR